jgi:hypothetical protein
MNGEEQKARGNAVRALEVRMVERLAQINREMIDLNVQMVKDYRAADDVLRLDITAETTLRKRALVETIQDIEEARRGLAACLYVFMTMPWYVRFAWVLFGVKALKFFKVSTLHLSLARPLPPPPPSNADGRL